MPGHWTKKPPTEPGWYWWRESFAYNAKIVWVSTASKVAEVFSFATHSTYTYGGEWFGPLRAPGSDSTEAPTA